MAGFEDIIGALDVMGYDIDDEPSIALGTEFGADPDLDALMSGREYPIVGADKKDEELRKKRRRAFLRHLAARHAAAVVPRPVTKAREYPLGFPTTPVAAGATVNITAQSQVPYRARRLIIASDIAGSFLVNDIKVGKNSMFASAGTGPVPARMFSEFGVGVDLNLDTSQISQLISINVTNISGATVNFNAGFIGTAVE
jgi:hypothetical protein